MQGKCTLTRCWCECKMIQVALGRKASRIINTHTPNISPSKSAPQHSHRRKEAHRHTHAVTHTTCSTRANTASRPSLLRKGTSTLTVFIQRHTNRHGKQHMLTPSTSQRGWRTRDCGSFYFFHGYF